MYYKWWIYQNIYLKIFNHFALRKYIAQVDKQEKPVFIHINKTAGTSIAHSLKIPESHFTIIEFEKIFKKQLGKELPLDISIYASIRNPFDKITSQYFYRIKTNQNNLGINTLSFDEWVKKAFDEKDPYYRDVEIMFMPQTKWLENAKGYKFNYIRFENLQEDFKLLQTKFNAEMLTWKKKSDNKNYESVYSNYSRSIIEREFKTDLETFNYKF